ncbi:hypothetical protein VB715_11335 [Crocosphaera sp. UHCC 0190]|uniref:hypothetical protein n=1 Tax=Crocosphaera sp. UHCC 0190 TaxID=3110246 RepID=UPI002B21AA01|nr:hypothetical protein [Crocosphaera sp. UHCC 0190]MEA5510357.1 hypothetical protein [Crocosphaera sp. UHCC 0190]
MSGVQQKIEITAQAQSSIQSTSIEINANELSQPLWLTIRTSNEANLQGQIKLNGQVIQGLSGQGSQVNLSNYLRRGEQEIVITGNYSPADASVMIELNGNNTQVSQQTSGNGFLNQQIRIGVR